MMSELLNDIVWIPATPSPWHQMFSVRCCDCNRKFKGRARHDDYEMHWHKRHSARSADGVASQAGAQMGVSRQFAISLGYRP